jgi:phosphatidate phosphatase APP1
MLIGDDGQHDPQLYSDAAADAPGKVLAVLIRELFPRRHSKAAPSAKQESSPSSAPTLRAPDGFSLLAQVQRRTDLLTG